MFNVQRVDLFNRQTVQIYLFTICCTICSRECSAASFQVGVEDRRKVTECLWRPPSSDHRSSTTITTSTLNNTTTTTSKTSIFTTSNFSGDLTTHCGYHRFYTNLYVGSALVSAKYSWISKPGLYLWGNRPLPTAREHGGQGSISLEYQTYIFAHQFDTLTQITGLSPPPHSSSDHRSSSITDPTPPHGKLRWDESTLSYIVLVWMVTIGFHNNSSNATSITITITKANIKIIE